MTRIPEQALYTAAQVRELDRRAIEDAGIGGYPLMCRAGEAAFRRLRFFWPGGSGRLLVLTGPGNNGGDGYVIARLALEAELPVTLVSAVDSDRLGGDAARARDDWLRAGGEISNFQEQLPGDTGLIVDALLGTGLARPPEGQIATLVNLANAHPAPVFAVDCPTGLDADTGQLLGDVVRASHTSTFVGRKRGLHTGQARAVCGRVHFERLDIPDAVYQGMTPTAFLIERQAVAACLRPRSPVAHKGRHGHVVVLGGDHGMGGAGIMAAEAALRAGAGRVSLLTRTEHVSAALARAPSLLVQGIRRPAQARATLATADVLVVGPGLGQGAWGRRLWRLALDSGRPLVLDADGLNLLARDGRRPPAGSILTPHPGEAGRLLSQSPAELEADRFAAVTALAERYQATVVLKGAGSLIAEPQGVTHVCDAGNAGMAVAGMGDILAGIAGGLRAQGLPEGEAAWVATWLHATAGDLAAREQGQRGLQAPDLLPAVQRLVNPAGERR
ncbi:NAD(P)H-hydrate dehydratase [Gammaproteobacteria bacterium AB-CW1]|uniref:Bifunctional NAD(P)H-hydrate repair enzyme n=1 Tax=Natronospira elongata TaxID=3110268 RepID=A0AAP6JGI5_9GAMM|nr:NAD(P)H-hydrate dehydratase [Gammaproteobacteria bacterium AB-CW1]